MHAALANYRAAFESLHAETVQAVWPGADRRALARAFEQLQSQSLDFYSCGIEFGTGTAEVTCTGSLTYVPKVGSKKPRVESRNWSFFLKKQSDRWAIERVVTR